jgi:soluble cytochrome b562
MSRVQKLRKEIGELELKVLDAKTRLDIALNEEATTRDELNQFSSLKAVMKKNGVEMPDNSKFVGAVVGARQLGFDPRVIVEKVSNVAKLEIDQKALEVKVEFLDEQSQKLEQTCSNLKQEELVHSIRISVYKDLESMGMGINELKLLWHSIREIATANKLDEDKASVKFFSDVREQYDDMLGFEVTLQNLKSDIQKNEVVQCQLSATTVMLNSIVMAQFAQIQNVSRFIEFDPLVKAAKGEIVPIIQLKNALIKALDILIGKIDSTDRSIGPLKTTRHLLQSDVLDSGDIA